MRITVEDPLSIEVDEAVIEIEVGSAGGPPGGPGADGPAGTITVNSTTTGAPGSNASVTNVGTSSAALLDFVIPRGDQGLKGDPGIQGPAGDGISKRHDYVTTGYGISYCGIAVTESAESAPVWRITRITVQSDGSTVTAVAVDEAWTNRLSATYV